MKLKSLIALMIIGILLAFTGGFLFHSFYVIQDVAVYEADAGLSEGKVFGFNLDKDKVHFGSFPINGSTGIRWFTANNTHDFEIEVSVRTTGGLKDWSILLEVQGETDKEKKMDYHVKPGETKEFKVVLTPPAGKVKVGTYEGKLILITKRTLFKQQNSTNL